MLDLKAVLFDLDGTLLDYDLRSEFLPHYFSAMGKYFAHRIEPEKMIKGIMLASDAIGANDGKVSNEQAFARIFYPYVGVEREILEPEFQAFYRDIFPSLRKYATRKTEARGVIENAFDLGYSVVIATNPYFPDVAVQQRLEWAGVAGLPYSKVTTYENSHFAKPDPRYFKEIVDEMGCRPNEALVVGDEAMDMVAGSIGCPTFLISSPATKEFEIKPKPTYRGSLEDVKIVLANNKCEP